MPNKPLQHISKALSSSPSPESTLPQTRSAIKHLSPPLKKTKKLNTMWRSLSKLSSSSQELSPSLDGSSVSPSSSLAKAIDALKTGGSKAKSPWKDTTSSESGMPRDRDPEKHNVSPPKKDITKVLWRVDKRQPSPYTSESSAPLDRAHVNLVSPQPIAEATVHSISTCLDSPPAVYHSRSPNIAPFLKKINNARLNLKKVRESYPEYVAIVPTTNTYNGPIKPPNTIDFITKTLAAADAAGVTTTTTTTATTTITTTAITTFTTSTTMTTHTSTSSPTTLPHPKKEALRQHEDQSLISRSPPQQPRKSSPGHSKIRPQPPHSQDSSTTPSRSYSSSSSPISRRHSSRSSDKTNSSGTLKSWKPCSCIPLDDDIPCTHPSTIDWSKLVPALILGILSLMVFLWAYSSPRQQKAMSEAATYTVMLLCLVLVPVYL